MLAPPPARHIDEVVAQLDDVIADCQSRQHRMGYFAALYRRVTVEVKGRMAKGQFADADRMEQLDVIFANRYLDAYHRHLRGEAPSRSWAYSFAAADDPDTVLLQHLLMGMNAHIHLDLGIAAAEVVRMHSREAFQEDFDLINSVLLDLVDEIQDEVSHRSGLLRMLDLMGGRLDERIFGVGLAHARGSAWERANALLDAPAYRHEALIDDFDQATERLSQRIHRLPPATSCFLVPLREVEQEPVDAIIARLM